MHTTRFSFPISNSQASSSDYMLSFFLISQTPEVSLPSRCDLKFHQKSISRASLSPRVRVGPSNGTLNTAATKEGKEEIPKFANHKHPVL